MFALLVAAVAAPVSPVQGVVAIGAGEQVVLRQVGPDMHWTVERRPAEPIGRAVTDWTRALQARSEAARSDTLSEGPVSSEALVPGQVTVRFSRQPDGSGMLLVVANGYNRRLAYAATMRRGPERQSTTVCTVPAGRFGIESWPFALDGIELGELALSPEMGAPLGC